MKSAYNSDLDKQVFDDYKFFILFLWILLNNKYKSISKFYTKSIEWVLHW